MIRNKTVTVRGSNDALISVRVVVNSNGTMLSRDETDYMMKRLISKIMVDVTETPYMGQVTLADIKLGR